MAPVAPVAAGGPSASTPRPVPAAVASSSSALPDALASGSSPPQVPPIVHHPPQEYLLCRLPTDSDLRRRFLWGWDAFLDWARANGVDMATQLRARLSAVGVAARGSALHIVAEQAYVEFSAGFRMHLGEEICALVLLEYSQQTRAVGRVLRSEDAGAADRLGRRIDWPGAKAFAALLAEGRSAERAELAGWSDEEEGGAAAGGSVRVCRPQATGEA